METACLVPHCRNDIHFGGVYLPARVNRKIELDDDKQPSFADREASRDRLVTVATMAGGQAPGNQSADAATRGAALNVCNFRLSKVCSFRLPLTSPRGLPTRPPPGLSPRARGNPGAAARAAARSGSIPASAGEPTVFAAVASLARVYPRERGGTVGFGDDSVRNTGLSPRARGNPITDGGKLSPAKVYPRERGGTAA